MNDVMTVEKLSLCEKSFFFKFLQTFESKQWKKNN